MRKESISKQNEFLNKWANRILNKLGYRGVTKKCEHITITELLENRFYIYGKCAECGRTIKLRKERND